VRHLLCELGEVSEWQCTGACAITFALVLLLLLLLLLPFNLYTYFGTAMQNCTSLFISLFLLCVILALEVAVNASSSISSLNDTGFSSLMMTSTSSKKKGRGQ